jgi:hypothetical protein
MMNTTDDFFKTPMNWKESLRIISLEIIHVKYNS